MNDASHNIGSITSSTKAHAVRSSSSLTDKNTCQDSGANAADKPRVKSRPPLALCALSASGLAAGLFAALGPAHVSVALAETLLTVGAVLIAALAGVVAADLTKHR
jgi:hypothetical protein